MMFQPSTPQPIMPMYHAVYERAENMRPNFRAVRLASLNRKLIAGIQLTICEMLERELLAD